MPLTAEQIESALQQAWGNHEPDAIQHIRGDGKPFTPIIRYPKGIIELGKNGHAFPTRESAINYAKESIESDCRKLTEWLKHRANRGLREMYGLPREI